MLAVKIIIADTQPMFAEGLSIILDAEDNIQVVATATDSGEVLEILKKVSCQVIMMDLHMPKESDLAAIRQIRKQYPQAHVLIFTGNRDTQFISSVILAGASGFVLKDTKKDELIQAIFRVADGEIFLGESVMQALTSHYKTLGCSLPSKL